MKNKNFFFQTIYYFKRILNSNQKSLALTLLAIMIFGMVFEILLLNNLMLLLNYLTNSNIKTPETVLVLMNYFNVSNPATVALLIFIITFFLKTLTTIVVRWKESKFIQTMKAEISEKLYTGYLRLPFIFHQRTNSAKILKNITLEIEQFAIFIFASSKFILELLVLIGISTYLMFIDPYISLACVFAFVIFGYMFNLFNRGKIHSMSVSRLFHQDERIKAIMEGLAGMREIKLLSREENKIKNFVDHNNQIAKISISITLRNAFTKPFFEIFMLILLSGFLFYFILKDLLNASLIPIIGIYLAAAYRLVPSISTIVQAIQEIQFNLRSVKNLYDDIKKFNANKLNNTDNKNKILFQDKIEIKNLSFSYKNEVDKKRKDILNNISLEIKKGDFVGIQGESGSGKSTFIDVLIGLHSLKEGSILVDGNNINEGVKSWQSLIGCVPQEVFIMDDTLKKNIAFGLNEEKISDQDVEKSLKFSNLKNFSQTLEKGVNTLIGEKGSRLSGGQKQRIGIARAIYNNPEILIFDESTNSLDVETENNIIEEINLLKKNKTLIIVSHNKEIFKKCDYVFKISEKKIKKISNIN
jgi:ATP-binding cassette, subfamily B, bacterial PglK